MSSYEDRDGLALADLVATRKASPRELLDEAVARARAVQPRLNPISQLFPERAEAAIAEGLPHGPFHGVPFLLKEIVPLAGTPTWAGSRLLRNTPPAEQDATLVERYKRAGLAIFGKTTTPEFGMAASTETSLTGITRNPWDPERTSGGSSGGAAVALATRVVPMAHGSDGGGSIRIPASCCGLFGLKPTRARTPSGPLVGEGWGSLAISHVLTRSVRDSAAMLDATHGPAPGDPYCAPPVAGSFLDAVGRPPGRLRVALQTAPFNGRAVDPDCLVGLQDAVRLMEELGHHVEPALPEVDWPELIDSLWVLVATNVRLAVLLANGGKEPAPGIVDTVIQDAVEFARTLPGEACPKATRAIHRHGRRMAAFHEKWDVLMSPTLAKPPVPLGPQHTNNPDLAAYREAVLSFSPFTSPFNMSGQPSMSVPLHWTPTGLPVGVMFSAAFGNEALLLSLAGQLEKARPWVQRKPPLASAA
ncbi:MAG: amidase [Alphaproteobacteria bacterium]|nr:amidase [Alphaproteobacteria bacterium]